MSTDSSTHSLNRLSRRENREAPFNRWWLRRWRFMAIAIGVFLGVVFYGMTALPQTQRNLVLKNDYLSTRRSLYTDSQVVQQYSDFPQRLPVVETAAFRPQVAQVASASDILQRYLSAALTGRTDSRQSMRNAANETRTLLNRYSAS